MEEVAYGWILKRDQGAMAMKGVYCHVFEIVVLNRSLKIV
jgi:hypothetical protein